jgi:hypothetical protein
MKFCKDCRHAEHVQKGTKGQWFCRHPVAGWHRGVDVVTGEDRNQEVPCQAARQIGECGYDPPRFWEAKGGGVGFVP